MRILKGFRCSMAVRYLGVHLSGISIISRSLSRLMSFQAFAIVRTALFALSLFSLWAATRIQALTTSSACFFFDAGAMSLSIRAASRYWVSSRRHFLSFNFCSLVTAPISSRPKRRPLKNSCTSCSTLLLTFEFGTYPFSSWVTAFFASFIHT